MKKTVLYYIALALSFCQVTSCKKFLEEKTDTSLSTVSTINDAQRLLDATADSNILPVIFEGEWSADNYYLTKENFDYNQGYGFQEIYIWGKYPFLAISSGANDWSQVYLGIMRTNTAIDAQKKISINDNNRQSWNNVQGSALAFRSYYFWEIATTFAKVYNQNSANTDLGIPLRLNANFNEKSTRSSVQQTYDQIINDLKTAIPLLPPTAAYITRPSKVSVYANLAEVYLSMGNYDKAGNYADSSLMIKHELLDYNLLDSTSSTPFPDFKKNKEMLIFLQSNAAPYYLSGAAVDTTLYASYSQKDLRKSLFFTPNSDNTIGFKGSYGSDNYSPFNGFTTAEMYLVRAESAAHKGDKESAMRDLNILLKNRYINTASSPFIDLTASSANEALQMIRDHRRKELLFRNFRWADIKRMNLEGANISLTRKIGDKIYSLPPNDNRFALQFPLEVIQISGMQQNPY